MGSASSVAKSAVLVLALLLSGLTGASMASAAILPGSPDVTFAAAPGGDGYAQSVPLPDGRILVTRGLDKAPDGRIGLLRLDASGAVDPSFHTAVMKEPSGYPHVNAIAVQGDGKILIGGSFSSYAGVATGNVARLHADGTIDPTFSTGVRGFDGTVNTVAVQSNGKVLVGGWFTKFNDTARQPVARLHDDGSLDLSFAPPTFEPDGGNVQALQVLQMSDGSVMVGGNFRRVDDVYHRGLVKLNPDGSLNKAFSSTGVGVGEGYIYGFVTDPDERIYVFGNFGKYNGVARPGIARVNPDGTLDPSFHAVDGFPGYTSTVFDAAIAADGRVVVANAEYPYDEPLHGVARLLSDGSVDPHFSLTGAGLRAASDVSIGSDGSILVSGVNVDIVEDQWVTTRRFIRLLGTGAPSSPRDLRTVRGDRKVTVLWSEPSDDGGRAVEGYTATAQPGGRSCVAESSQGSCAVTGLTNGQTYQFTVSARNSHGDGLASEPVTATPATLPGPPAVVTAEPGFRSALVSWQAPANDGGEPVTGYRVRSQPGGASCVADSGQRSCVVAGLRDLQTYSFTAHAVNAVGQGSASEASAPVTLGGDEAVAAVKRIGEDHALAGVAQTFSAVASTTLSGAITKVEWQVDNSGYEAGDTSFTHTWSTPGTHTVSVRVTGESGEASVARETVDVLPRSTRRSGVSINDAAAYTNTRQVTLHLGWPDGAKRAQLSNDGGFQSPTTVLLEDVVNWTLDDRVKGTNTKVVYVRFQGKGVDETRTYTDDIIFDNKAPRIGEATAAAATAKGASLAGAGTSVRVQTSAKDKVSGLSKIQIGATSKPKQAIAVRYKKSVTVHLPASQVMRVSVRVRDKANNWSQWRRVTLR